VMRK